MAKEIKTEDAVPGRFYKHRGKVVFCVADAHGKEGEVRGSRIVVHTGDYI